MVGTLAGAILLKGGSTLELGAIMRGPIHAPQATTFVFGFDRGEGSALGSEFPSAPGITIDATVAVTVTPTGDSVVINSATVNDRVTGSSTPLPASDVQVNGPVIRIWLPTSVLPSKVLPLAKYRFTFWSQLGSGGIETIGSFVPSTMIPIGVQPGQPRARVHH
jgi:hypothetical protein